MKKLTYTQQYIAKHILNTIRPEDDGIETLESIIHNEFRNYGPPLKWPTKKDHKIASKYARSVLDKSHKVIEDSIKSLEKSMKKNK